MNGVQYLINHLNWQPEQVSEEFKFAPKKINNLLQGRGFNEILDVAIQERLGTYTTVFGLLTFVPDEDRYRLLMEWVSQVDEISGGTQIIHLEYEDQDWFLFLMMEALKVVGISLPEVDPKFSKDQGWYFPHGPEQPETPYFEDIFCRALEYYKVYELFLEGWLFEKKMKTNPILEFDNLRVPLVDWAVITASIQLQKLDSPEFSEYCSRIEKQITNYLGELNENYERNKEKPPADFHRLLNKNPAELKSEFIPTPYSYPD